MKNKKFIIKQLERLVNNYLERHIHCEDVLFPSIAAKLQYGVANTELTDLTAIGRQLVLVKAAVSNINSIQIAPELFQNLTLKKKKELKPFIKEKLNTLMSAKVIRKVDIPNIKEM